MTVETLTGASAGTCAIALPGPIARQIDPSTATFHLVEMRIVPEYPTHPDPRHQPNPTGMLWKFRDTRVDLTHRAWVMGILNVTPDSFSDGGLDAGPDAAADRGLALLADGADLLDIGGESTRPGASPVVEEEELRRILPVIRRLRSQTTRPISIDTRKSGVAQAALDAGADIVNDISALRADPAMADVVSRHRAGLILMHMQGTPESMQTDPSYADVTAEVLAFLRAQLRAATDAGIDPECVALDPGIGFGKSTTHNLRLLHDLPQFAQPGRPVVLGVSRKSFLGRVLGIPDPTARLWPAVALAAFAVEKEARILRVHDVKETVDAVRMSEAIRDVPRMP